MVFGELPTRTILQREWTSSVGIIIYGPAHTRGSFVQLSNIQQTRVCQQSYSDYGFGLRVMMCVCPETRSLTNLEAANLEAAVGISAVSVL